MKLPLQFSVAMLVLAGVLISAPAFAQTVAKPAPAPASGATTTFAISGFELAGEVPLDAGETARVLAPFIGPKATLDVLQKAAAALEAALAAKGYGLHRVALPAQELGGKVALNVVKFVIGKVTVQGNTVFSEANVRASLPELREGASPNFSRLAVQTSIANESAARQVQLTIKESEEADRIDAQVTVRDGRAWSGSLSVANTGTDATGNDRSTIALSHANLFDADHQASVAFTTSMERSDTVKQLGLNYRIPLYRQGAVVGMSYTASDVVGNFGSFNSTGAGQTLGVNVSMYAAPQGGYRGYWTVALDDKIFNATRINGTPVFGQVDRNSRPLSLGYAARSESDTSLWSYDAQWAINLPGDAGNTLAAYRVEDLRINTVQWSALRGTASWLAPLPAGWTWGLKGQWQYSPDALIAGEQLGLGGAAFGRGTSERNTSGDSGVAASLEVTTRELQPGLRFVGFVDAGWLTNNNAGASTAAKPAIDQLASMGVGLRYNTAALSLGAEWGHVVTGVTQPPGGNPNLARAGDTRLHVNLTGRF